MSDTRPVRRAATGVAGITLAGAAALVGVAGPAEAAPNPSRAVAQACSWAAQVLPTVPITDFAASAVRGTDGNQTFAGYSNGHAVLWRDGRLIDLGVGVAEDVNGSGDAAGTQQDSNYVPHATLFRAGTAVRLAEPANAGETHANGINDAGLIVGSAGVPGPTGGTWHALVWSAHTPGDVIDLGTLYGKEANGTRLVGVNEAGTLIGNAYDPNTSRQTAVIGTVHGGLRALRGSTRDASTVANAITGRYVAGIRYLNGGIQTVRWVNGRAQVLPGAAEASGVNSQGTVVGRRSDLITGLIWTGAADPVELPIPTGLSQAGAAAITDGGTVGGYGFNDRSEALPVLWSCR